MIAFGNQKDYSSTTSYILHTALNPTSNVTNNIFYFDISSLSSENIITYPYFTIRMFNTEQETTWKIKAIWVEK